MARHTAEELKTLFTDITEEEILGVQELPDINPDVALGQIRERPTALPFSTGTNIVGSSNAIRDDENEVRFDANEVISGIGDFDDITQRQLDELLGSELFSQTTGGQEAQTLLDEMRRNLGITTGAEETEISRAGDIAGGRFASLISAAEEAKRKGLPKAVVGAGERGGFQSTQFAGIAALLPTAGGDFIGTGGELANIQTVFDVNISNLKAQAQQSRLQAESDARKAIRTGKRTDLKDAQDSFDRAQRTSKEAIDLAAEKSDAIASILNQTINRTKQIFDIASDLPEGETFTDPISGFTITGIATPEDAKRFFTGANIISLMKTIPRGQTQEIEDPNTGEVYTIGGLADPDIIIAKNNKTGVMSGIDKNTGETLWSVEGAVGITGGGGTGPAKDAEEAENRTAISADIDAITGEDGFVDTAKYQQLRREISVQAPDMIAWFDRTFKPQDILNPKDATAQKFFQTGGQQIKAGEEEEKEERGFNEQIIDFMDGLKTSGLSKKEIEKFIEAEYGQLFDFAKKWLKENF